LNGAAVLTWASIPNATYRVQYKSALADPTWNDLTPNITATDSTTSATDANSPAAQRYYRIVALP
jgi:hypothetical protein